MHESLHHKGQENIINLTHISWNLWSEESPAIRAPLEDPHCGFPASAAEASSEQHGPWAERAARHSQAFHTVRDGFHTDSRRAPRGDSGRRRGH